MLCVGASQTPEPGVALASEAHEHVLLRGDSDLKPGEHTRGTEAPIACENLSFAGTALGTCAAGFSSHMSAIADDTHTHRYDGH